MRHTCQIYVGAVQCGKPAVDCVEIDDHGAHDARFNPARGQITHIWMCAQHWDDYHESTKETTIDPEPTT